MTPHSSPFVFGEELIGIHASPKNPHRTGKYVRTYYRKGKINPGIWIELTDCKGDFWSYPLSSVKRSQYGCKHLDRGKAAVPAEWAGGKTLYCYDCKKWFLFLE